MADSTITRHQCFACGKAFKDGDLVYEDVNEGLIHAACCGPERESYANADGEPLKPGEPIPEPLIYRAETKGFDPAAIATLSTGTLLVQKFSLAHEAAEWIMGHPIWVHQFPALLPKMRERVLAQFPDMPTECAAGQHEAVRDAARARYGDVVEVERGDGETAIHPLDASTLATGGARHG